MRLLRDQRGLGVKIGKKRNSGESAARPRHARDVGASELDCLVRGDLAAELDELLGEDLLRAGRRTASRHGSWRRWSGQDVVGEVRHRGALDLVVVRRPEEERLARIRRVSAGAVVDGDSSRMPSALRISAAGNPALEQLVPMTAAMFSSESERVRGGRATLGAAAVVLVVELDLAAGDSGRSSLRDLDAVLAVEAQVRSAPLMTRAVR